jgi:hypothetical protein
MGACVIDLSAVEALKYLCRSALNDGKPAIMCPGTCNCNVKWEFFVVRHVLQAAMTPDELNTMSEQLNRAYILRPTADIRQCAACQTYCTRDFSEEWVGNRNRVVCRVCTRKSETVIEFCWLCGLRWISGDDAHCGNASCDGPQRSLRVLANCPLMTKPDYMKGCPSTRACPRCGTLIEHNEGCKHMTCTRCGLEFCFICLRVKRPEADGGWPASCRSPYGYGAAACRVAVRQTTIPDPTLPRPPTPPPMDPASRLGGGCTIM